MLNYKDNVGKILFASSFILLLFMFLSPLNDVIVHVDEFFTFGLVKFSFIDLLTITSNDVHPPLYYIILKFFSDLFNLFPITLNDFFVAKVVSIIPYILIIGVSFFKLKKEYGWLTIGIFVFSLAVMSEFFVHYHLIRMYSWGLFFTLMSFIYFKDIITKSDYKSWVLFAIFNILGIYTHYFFAFSSAALYFSLLIYLFCFKQDDFKKELKKFIGSIILAVILFSPWMLTFLSQLGSGATSWIPSVDFELCFNSFTYFINYSDYIPLKILAAIGTLYFIFIAFKHYDSEPTDENFYIFSGVFIFLGTVIISIIISIVYKPILVVRYLIPVSSIIWLSISILIGKLKSDRLVLISLVLILLLGVSGIGNIFSESNYLVESSAKQTDIIDEINADDNSILIINHTVALWQFASFFNDTDIYAPEDDFVLGVSMANVHDLYDFEEKTPQELNEIIHSNATNVYFMDFWGNFDSNITNATELGRVGGNHVYKID